MDKLNSFLQWCNLTPISDYDSFFNGLVVGLFLLLFCAVMVYILLLIVKVRCKCKGITISSETGELFITTSALKDFVRRTLRDELPQVTLSKVVLKQQKGAFKLKLAILAPHSSNVSYLKDAAETLILSGMSERLAITESITIVTELKGFNDKKVAATKQVFEKVQPAEVFVSEPKDDETQVEEAPLS